MLNSVREYKLNCPICDKLLKPLGPLTLRCGDHYFCNFYWNSNLEEPLFSHDSFEINDYAISRTNSTTTISFYKSGKFFSEVKLEIKLPYEKFKSVDLIKKILLLS